MMIGRKIEEANKLFRGIRCPSCGAWAGDPCRTPRWRITDPHKARLRLVPKRLLRSLHYDISRRPE